MVDTGETRVVPPRRLVPILDCHVEHPPAMAVRVRLAGLAPPAPAFGWDGASKAQRDAVAKMLSNKDLVMCVEGEEAAAEVADENVPGEKIFRVNLYLVQGFRRVKSVRAMLVEAGLAR